MTDKPDFVIKVQLFQMKAFYFKTSLIKSIKLVSAFQEQFLLMLVLCLVLWVLGMIMLLVLVMLCSHLCLFCQNCVSLLEYVWSSVLFLLLYLVLLLCVLCLFWLAEVL